MTPRITSIEGNRQRLDGGAMFGNAPRALWARWAEPDAQNRIELACRSFLVEEPGGRRVLLEAGIGAFFEPKLRDRYGVEGGGHRLLDGLARFGLSPGDIDVVVLSHLHFDHAGGLLPPWPEPPRLVFPRARLVVGAAHWRRATAPHPRDRASFVPAIQELLEESGRLELVEGERSAVLGPGWRLRRSDGHTPGMLLAELEVGGVPVVFAGDLVPGVAWMHPALAMGYDRCAERVCDEKRALLDELAERGGWLLLTHDPAVAAVRVGRDERGRPAAAETRAALDGALA